MTIHSQALKAMKRNLEEGLSNCQITNGFPEVKSVIDCTRKFVFEGVKHLKDWLTKADIFTIVVDSIDNSIKEKDGKSKDYNGILIDLVGKEGLVELKENILKFLESIPRPYTLYFHLPSAKDFGVPELSLTEHISLIEVINEDDFHQYIPRYANRGLLNCFPRRPHKGFVYAKIKSKGFAQYSINDSAIQAAFSKFKQFVQLGLSLGVLKVGSKQQSSIFGDIRNEILIYDDSATISEGRSIYFPLNVDSFISKLQIDNEAIDRYSMRVFKKEADKLANKRLDVMKLMLTPAIKLSEKLDNDKDAESIKTAIEWAFESLTNENKTFAFIQTCIGLEAILGGDSDQESLSTSLADRCAYLIGRKISNRKQIKKSFRKLYEIRSKLVHGRRKQLNNEEDHFFLWAQGLLNEIIRKELSYL